MTVRLDIPPEAVAALGPLTDEERGRLAAFVLAAAGEAVREWQVETEVRRTYARYEPAYGYRGALGMCRSEAGVSESTAERILGQRWGRQPEQRREAPPRLGAAVSD